MREPILSRFRLLCPEVDIAAGISETRRFYLLNLFRLSRFFRSPAKAFMVPEYSGRLRPVTPRFIRSAHALGMLVHVWTVNEVEDTRRLIDWGADRIITDYPGRLLALLIECPPGRCQTGTRLASGTGELVAGSVENVQISFNAWSVGAEQQYRSVPGKRRPGLVRGAVHIRPKVNRC